MAVPKKRHSKARTRKRNANWKADAPSTVECPQCGEAKLPHRVCPECGWYNHKQVIEK